jgi:hypothetical protein
MPRRLAMLAVASLLASAGAGGCAALQSAQGPGETYVAADRATYEALAPEYAAYVAADPALADDDRARRAHALETWRLRIEAAEQAGAATSTGVTLDPIAAP